MQIQENISLKNLTTMHVGGNARFFVSIKNERDLAQAVQFAHKNALSIFVLGGGSNIVISEKGVDGFVIKNEIKGRVYDEEEGTILLTTGAGEIWDEIVKDTVEKEFSGIENLSAIPGTVGAAPVQNIGAYGVEFKDVFESLRAFDIDNGTFRTFLKDECDFAYRNSFFKKNKHFIISSVTLRLKKIPTLNLTYRDIKEEIHKRKLDETLLTSLDLREMVITIRKKKLPDWRTEPTAGSFFKNPEIDKKDFERLKKMFPEVPGFETQEGKVKVPLAWIIEHVSHLKGSEKNGVRVFEKHALVLVNIGGASANDIKSFSEYIAKDVFEKTGITIESEVQFIGEF